MHQPLFQKIHVAQYQSYNILKVKRPYFVVPWHFHPEIELMMVLQGSGTRFIGDHIERFGPHDLVLVGAHLPHVWKNDPQHYEPDTKVMAEARVILFSEDCFGQTFFSTPEMENVKALLEKASRGIRFYGKTQDLICKKILKAYQQQAVPRLLLFLEILDELSKSTEYELLTSIGYSQHTLQKLDFDRLNPVLDFLLQHYTEPIQLDQVAAMAYMSTTAFCRYFKSRTHKTVIQFTNELRIGYSHKLLIETSMPVSEICYKAGFNNLSNFYDQFQKISGITPKKFKEKHLHKEIF